MALNSVGDQARAYAMQVKTGRLKTTLNVLTKEVASGEVADLGQRLQGNTRILNDVESRLQLLQQYQRNASEAASFLQGMQDRLNSISNTTSSVGTAILAETATPSPDALATRGSEITQIFSTVVSQLNGAIAGQRLFSGLATTTMPLISAEAMLDELEIVIAGLTTAPDIAQAVSAWFDAPSGGGGFLDIAYSGTANDPRTLLVAQNNSVRIETTAATPAIRDLLKGLATASLVDRGTLNGQPAEQYTLMKFGANEIVGNDMELIQEISKIGLSQKTIETIQAENASSISALTAARNDIRQADPYETSIALTQVESQLEAQYTVTARLSNLKLTNYLK